MAEFIDLGKKPETVKASNPVKEEKNKKYFPSAYISGVDGLDVEDGDEVLIKGKVTGCSSTTRGGKTTYTCDVECQGLKVVSSGGAKDGGLDGALDKIAEKKAMDDDDGDE